jgi:hypothetical protein
MGQASRTLALLSTSIGALMVAGGLESAMATGCSASSGYVALTQAQIENVVGNSVACYPSSGPPWTNQEYHSGTTTSATGNITDYKQGPTNPRDPSKQIGTYSISSTNGLTSGIGTISYNYGGASSYSFRLWGPTPPIHGPTNYDLCVASVRQGSASIRPATGGPRAC